MALDTVAGGKMLVGTRVMTIRTGRNNTFYTGRMFCMTFSTGKIFKMSPAVICKVLDDVFMAGRAVLWINGCIPVVGSGLMGQMTDQTVLELHFRAVFIMAVKTGLELSLGQPMLLMTVGTVLLVMGTGDGG
jgi:hypothetical protein